MSEPWIIRGPGELLYASDWNTVQSNFAAELRDHDHTGGGLGAQLGGESFDSSGTLRVASLVVTESLTVDGLDVMQAIDAALPQSGGAISGDLRVGGTLRVGGQLRFTPATTGVFQPPIEVRCSPRDTGEVDARGLPLRYYRLASEIPDGVIAAITLPKGLWIVRVRGVVVRKEDLAARYLYSNSAQLRLDRKTEQGSWTGIPVSTYPGPPQFAIGLVQSSGSVPVRVWLEPDSAYVVLEADLLALPVGG